MEKTGMIFQTIVVLFLMMVCCQFAIGQQITTFIKAETISSGPVEKVYEISPSSRDIGYGLEVREKEQIQMPVLDTMNYLYISKISEDYVIISKMTKDGLSIDPERSNITLRLNETKIMKFMDSGKSKDELVRFTLVSVEPQASIGPAGESSATIYSARVYFQNLDDAIGMAANYTELFDIDVKLAKTKIGSASELVASVNFLNFGEGASQIFITYTITDSEGRELYSGVDNRIVYAQDSLIKRFDGLNLPEGDYILESRIDYGKDQTANSALNFRISQEQDYSQYLLLGIFAVLIIGLFAAVSLKRHSLRKAEGEGKGGINDERKSQDGSWN
jgi:hypothetical protein